MHKAQAMEGFVDLLDRLCPSFRPYIEAIRQDRDEKRKIANVEEEKCRAILEVEQKRQKIIEDEQHKEEIQKRKLQDALNQQTFHQFKEYAEKQFPGNTDEQARLIKQLQNEHYHQYIQVLINSNFI